MTRCRVRATRFWRAQRTIPDCRQQVILNDYLAGYLTAMGVIAALILRAKHGGSYHVRASLTRYSMWFGPWAFEPGYVA
jgi:crotonobetainyl-CoA:carnitine CoA-transferase CaiB-like acyl-CoA transferase